MEYIPKIYFDLSINQNEPQRITFELYKDKVPDIVEDFKVLLTNETSPCYKGTKFERITTKYCQGCPFGTQDNYRTLLYLQKSQFFSNESRTLEAGLLALLYSNSKPGIFIITTENLELDQSGINLKAVVIGKVIQSEEVLINLQKIAKTQEKEVVIVKCGELIPEMGEDLIKEVPLVNFDFIKPELRINSAYEFCDKKCNEIDNDIDRKSVV